MLPKPPSNLFNWSQIVAGFGSVLLTGFLVVLYKRQQQQLAAQHEAVLEVTDVEWYRDKAIIWVSNFGNGVAKNLHLTTLVKSDNGDHRNYSIRHHALKRVDVGSEWGNHIRADEEDIPFTGKSIVGQTAPRGFPGDWVPLRFSVFIRNAKDNGADQVKYLHLIQGRESSGDHSLAEVNNMTRSVNPQAYDTRNSLESLPGYTEHGRDSTFRPYFRESTIRNWGFKIYARAVRVFDRVIPRAKIRQRPLDASGTKRVRRVFLRRDLLHKKNRLKKKVEPVTSRIPSPIKNRAMRVWTLISSFSIRR